MNIQARPDEAKIATPLFPAVAEQPIRAVFLQEDRLHALGESLARNELVNFNGLEAFDFQARHRDNAAKILETYRSTNSAQARGEPITPAAQWLLDNNYLVEETIFQIKRDLPQRFYRQLPMMKLPGGGEVPRALALAWVYVAHSDSAVSSQMLKALVDGYPERRTAQDRRTMGAAVAAALRADRESAAHRRAREARARDAPDRQ